MAGYPPGAGMPWGNPYGAHHPPVQQLQQRPQALPIEALGLPMGSRIEVCVALVGAGWWQLL